MKPKKTGILNVDQNFKGIPGDDLAVVETNSDRVGLALLARFIYTGLQENETCVVVTHLPEKYFFKNMSQLGLDFSPYLKNKFTLLKYCQSIKTETSLTADFEDIFKEIYRMSGSSSVDRLAFHQFDSLLNLNTQFLINTFVHKFAASCRSGLTRDTSVLCEFQNFGDKTHNELATALQKISGGYYKIHQADSLDWTKATFQVLKQPWFDFSSSPFDITLKTDTNSGYRGMKIA